MIFKLSGEMPALFEKAKRLKPMSGKRIKYYDSQKFYKLHPDLAPGDIYLSENRIISQKEWDKSIKKFERQISFEIFTEKLKNNIKNYLNLFKANK